MYEETYGTDWETIDDRDELVTRGYALGIAEQLGEEYPGELERLAGEAATTYDRSFVELAYQKGRDEAEAAPIDDAEKIWEKLIEEKTEIDPLDRDELPDWDALLDDGTGSLPDALDRVAIDTLPDDSTERVKRPSFLERDPDVHPAARDTAERTPFGRSVDDVRGSDADAGTDGAAGDGSTADRTAAETADGPGDGGERQSDATDERGSAAGDRSGTRSDSAGDSDET